MSNRGSLTDFSLVEILQFIENGKRTGLLTLSTLSVSRKSGLSSARLKFLATGQCTKLLSGINRTPIILEC
ncbi:DUF4388 domain-containing protein [Cyanobacteria bacterium FACHB-472]|nr:DUF4388 domain-containing protein [Cyanobacteria bacterium FACHB-472]